MCRAARQRYVTASLCWYRLDSARRNQCQVRCDDSLGTVSESDDERAKIQLRLHRDVLMWPSLLMMKPGAGDEAD